MGFFARQRHLWSTHTLLAAALVIFFGAVGFLLLRPSEKTRAINYHLRRLEDLTLTALPPQGLADALRWRRIRFALSQKFSPQIEWGTEMQNHRKALIELGYFTERRFDLGSTNLYRQLYPAVMRTRLKDTNWSYFVKNGTSVFVTTATFDIPKWEQIFSNLNQNGSNQH